MNHKSLRFELLMISTWFLGVMAVKFTLPLLPTLAEQFHATPTLVKYSISIFLFGKASGMLAFGPLSERYGRRRFMLIGLILFAAGNLLAAVAANIEVLLFARLLQGFGVSATVLMGRAMINDKHKNNEALSSLVMYFSPHLSSSVSCRCWAA